MKDNIVILSSIEWGFVWQRHQTLAKMFAETGWNVIFIESSAKRNPNLNDISRIFKRLFCLIRKNSILKCRDIHENLTIVQPIVLPATYKTFRTINKLFFIPRLIRKIKILMNNNGAPIIWCYLPTQTSLDIIKGILPSLLVYDCVTNFLSIDDTPKDIYQTEAYLIKKADIIIADSDYLFRNKMKFRKDILKIPPGVNYRLFKQADYDEVDNRKVCYFGTIDEKIDFYVIECIANSGYDVLMVGPVKITLPKLPLNICFIGSVSHVELPQYLKNCKCIIIPYIINEFTKGVIPAKIYECLATGKPIITTPLPEFMHWNNNLIYIAHTPHQFVNMLERLNFLETKEKRQKRQQVAYRNSWDSRFNKILQTIRLKLIEKNAIENSVPSEFSKQ